MPAAPDRSSGGQPNDVGLSAITMLVICANLAWTALYVNSDSPAAAIFPLLLGLGILERRPDGSRLADTPFVKKIAACKMHYCALAWGVMLFVGVAVCVSLARAAEGIALDVQLAASNGEVIGAGFCGSLTCELPPMRFVKASGMATNYAFCNTTSIGAVECDGDGTALQGIFLEVEFSGSPASENNQVSRITDLLFEMRDFDNSVQLSLDDTMCPDGFSFGFWRHGLFAWDVWHVRCNGWVLHALVAAGTIEVGRESSASQGVTCGSYQRTDIAHILGKRGVKGVWALTGESIRAIDDGLTVLFVGQALGGVDHVIQAIRDIGVQSDEDATILDTLLEIRNDGSNGTILSGTERSCFVGGGGDSITIDEANNQDVVAAVENSTDEYFEEVFSFSTFTWVTEAKAFNDGFTVADRRDGMLQSSTKA
eukprot:g14932.t1